ncbi:MAG: cysteine-rich CWC family protein [Acidobacteriota bacterium]
MVLRRLASFFIPSLRKPMTCQSCGENFICGAGLTGCWCMEVKLDTPTRAKMRQQFNDCLCRQCLEGFAKNSAVSGETVLEES